MTLEYLKEKTKLVEVVDEQTVSTHKESVDNNSDSSAKTKSDNGEQKTSTKDKSAKDEPAFLSNDDSIDKSVSPQTKSIDGVQCSTDSDSEDEIHDEYDDIDLIGQTVGGHYEILSRIGSGGMSTVFKAKHMLLDKFVAIKFIRKKLIYDKGAAKRFRQEAKASTELHHENICAVKEYEIHAESRPFLVMDYLEGKSLTDVIAEEGPLATLRALEIAAEICQGLAHAHSKNVIHRDIKPGNVVLVKDSRGAESVRLVDFGLAKLLRQEQAGPNLTQTGEIFGTPNYMSPEQCLGKTVDERSDIYSLGCLMHEMIYGKPPFQASSNIEVIMSHVSEQPKLKNNSVVDALILKCLEKDPYQRYTKVGDLLDDLNSIRENKNLVHAKQKRAGTKKVEQFIVAGLTILILSMAAGVSFKINSNNMSWLATKRNWQAETDKAAQFIEANKLTDAEISLQKALKIAEASGSSELKSTALNNLSSLEFNLGKWEQARNHTQMASLATERPKPNVSHLRDFGMITACAMILTGIGIFVFFLLLVSKSQNLLHEGKLREFFTPSR
jgi:serine/threonine protein kinase